MKNFYQKEIQTPQGIKYLNFLDNCISNKMDNSNVNYFFRELKMFNNQKQNYTIDVLPTYKCNLRCNYCYSRKTRENFELEYSEEEKSRLIINEIKKKINNKPFDLGFIGGGEPLIEKNLILNIIDNVKPINILRIVTNGLFLDEEFIQQIYSKDMIERIFWNISINYINFDLVLKNLRELKRMLKNKEVLLMFYINDKFNMMLLKNGIKEILSSNMFFIKIKPIIFDGKIQNQDEYYEIVKYFIQNSKNNTIFDFMETCTNIRRQSYFTIDCFGRIYKCHAQAGLIKDNPKKLLYKYGKCIYCCYFPICLGGCFPDGNRPKDKCSCIFFNHITNIIKIYSEQLK